MVLLIAFICSAICTTEEKVFQLENLRFFLFQVFDLQFCTHKKIILQQCLDPIRSQILTFFRIRSRPKHSDSFGFGSTTLIFGPSYCNACIFQRIGSFEKLMFCLFSATVSFLLWYRIFVWFALSCFAKQNSERLFFLPRPCLPDH
jgi:hypothetical protein